MSSLDIGLMQAVRFVWTIMLCEFGYGLIRVGMFLGSDDLALFVFGFILAVFGFDMLRRAYLNALDVCYPDKWIADMTDSNDIGRGPLYW